MSAGTNSIGEFKDEDFRSMMLRAMRLIAVLAAVLTPLLWWKSGWQTAALLWVGAGISAIGLWKWLRLAMAVMQRMDAGGQARPMAGVLLWFFAQLAGAFVVLYVSLKFLNGSVYALVGGLGLGAIALSIEGFRAMKAWTV